MMVDSSKKAIILKSHYISLKNTRTSGGTALMTLKKGHKITNCIENPDEEKFKGYRKIKFPATGLPLSKKDLDLDQLRIDG